MTTPLTKQQAKEAMREGKKVRHEYFMPDEWMRLTATGLYQFDDGHVIPSLLFWADRKGEKWLTGWSIVED